MASSTDIAVVTVWPADANAMRMNVTVAGWSSTIRINMAGGTFLRTRAEGRIVAMRLGSGLMRMHCHDDACAPGSLTGASLR
jgi:hypothetical protein